MKISELKQLRPTSFMTIAAIFTKRINEITHDNYADFFERAHADVLIQSTTNEAVTFQFKQDELAFVDASFGFRETRLASLQLKFVPVGYFKKKRTWLLQKELVVFVTQFPAQEVISEDDHAALSTRIFTVDDLTITVTVDKDPQRGNFFLTLRVDKA